MDWIDTAKSLRSEGNTYSQISKMLFERMGIDKSEDAIRYNITRKNKEIISQKERLAKDGIKKVLILNDLHCPYNLDILPIVERHRDEISLIVLGGDTIDCEEISTFPKINKKPLGREMVEVHSLLKKIDNLTPEIKKVVLLGNHEKRFGRYLANTNTALNEIHSDNIMKEIVNGFTYYNWEDDSETKCNQLKNYEVLDDWYFQLNDLIICHPISFSRINGRTAVSAVEFFLANNYNFRAIAVAHTHKMASTIKYGRWTCETGCLCKEMDYANSGKLNFTPQDNGFLIATFVEGRFSVNESQIVYL